MKNKYVAVKDVFKEEGCIGGKYNGRFFRNEIEIMLDGSKKVVIDFDGIELITQSFSDEFLGPIVAIDGTQALEKMVFKNCTENIKAMLNFTANRFITNHQSA